LKIPVLEIKNSSTFFDKKIKKMLESLEFSGVLEIENSSTGN